jgi:nickel-dependent lactate racemase
MQCDFKIAISCITPHPFVGFGGGSKIILPGVASIETIMANHDLPITNKKNHEANPIRSDIDEGASFVGLDVSIECIVNLWGDTAALFVGPPGQSHAAGVSEAKTHYLTPMAKDKDIVVVNTYARVNEAGIGAELAFPSVSHKGGDVVLICNAPQGQVVHYLLGWWGKRLGGCMKRFEISIPEHINHLIVYTEYPDIPGLGCFEQSDKVIMISKWDDVLLTLKNFHKDDATVAIYPNADIQYFG